MEGDAGTSRLNRVDTDNSPTSEVMPSDSDSADSDADIGSAGTAEVGVGQTGIVAAEDSSARHDSPSRLGRGWFIGIIVTLLVSSAGVGAGAYFAMDFHRKAQAIASRDTAAVQAAKDCVTATQAPDIAAMAASQEKIITCGTGDFRAQAVLYSSLLVDAYQAANAHVQVSDIRAAAEHNNDDGSVDVLVALRVKVTNSESQNQEAGYRLRVKMALDNGQYRIARLDQVAK